jgi:predicted MPP superfamily phosphohydrolase
MKIFIIGDIHGRTIWKKYNEIEKMLSNDEYDGKYDKYVFLGDYCDSFYIKDKIIYDNIIDIINFKKKFKNKVILLWGNHEMNYLFSDDKYNCSGYRPTMWIELNKLLNTNKELFNFSYQYKNYIFTHAGIHNEWYEKNFKKYDIHETISESLNYEFNNKLDCLFDIGLIRGGDKDWGGPLWLDIILGSKNPLHEYKQFVGHSITRSINKFEFNKNTYISYCDIQKYYDKTSFYLLDTEKE